MKQFKFASIADIHYDLFQNISLLRDDLLTDRVDEIDNLFKEVIDNCVRDGITHLFVLGDTHHRRNIRSDAVNILLQKRLKYAKEKGLTVIILVGNHDQAAISGKVHSLETLKDICEVIDEPCIKNYFGVDFYFLPYEEYNGSKTSLEILFKKGKNSNRFLMGHVGIKDAALSGFDHLSKEPITVDDLQMDKFIHCYFGHYHFPQAIGKNGMYIGSLCQHSLGDKLCDRGYVETEVTMDGAKWRVSNELKALDSPKFIEVSADEYNPKNYIGKNYIKVTDCDRKQVEKLQTDTNVMSTTGVKLERVVDDKKAIQIDLGWSEMLEKYVEITEPKKKNHKRLIKTGSEFIE